MSNRHLPRRPFTQYNIEPGEELEGARMLPLRLIDANPKQPRQHTNEARLRELRDDIAARGILQPLVVRPLDDRYQVVAGGRRYAAATALGLELVPVVIKEMSDEEVWEASLVENLQREDLDIEDEAYYLKMLHESGKSLRQIAGSIHKSVNYIQRRLRLLDEPGALQAYRDGMLTLNSLLEGELAAPDDVAMPATGTETVSPGIQSDETQSGEATVSPGIQQRGDRMLEREPAVVKPFGKLSAWASQVKPETLPPATRTALASTLDILLVQLTELRDKLGE